MPSLTLTEKFVAKRFAERQTYFDRTTRGLVLRVTPATKSWAFVYAAGRRRRWLHLGSYPALSLAEARRLATEKRRLVDAGRDAKAGISVSEAHDKPATERAVVEALAIVLSVIVASLDEFDAEAMVEQIQRRRRAFREPSGRARTPGRLGSAAARPANGSCGNPSQEDLPAAAATAHTQRKDARDHA